MKFTFPYGQENLNFEADENIVLFTGEQNDVPSVNDLELTVIYALDNPIDAPPLRVLALGKRNILFLIEDNTRETPLRELLPIVAHYLNENGVDDDRISLMIAPGTHRRMTQSEILEKLGADLVSRFKISQHDAMDTSAITDLGTVDALGYSVPIRVNCRALAADLLVGFGNIVPHCNAGFSGGAKILIPGVCDFATTAAIHAAAAFYEGIQLGENETNPCRIAIETGAREIGLHFIINVVLNGSGCIAGVFAGDFVKTHRVGAALAAEAFRVDIPETADIVIASSSPADLDFWQAGKGLAAASTAIRNGGIIILAAACGEGLEHNHPLYRKYLRQNIKENLSVISNFSPDDSEADIIAASVASENCKINSVAQVFIITNGLTDDDIETLGFVRFANVQSALDAALKIMPRATVGILPQSGITLPILKNIKN